MYYLKLQVEGSEDNCIECTTETVESAFLIYYSFMNYQKSKNIEMTILTDVFKLPNSRLNFERGMHSYTIEKYEARQVQLYSTIQKVVLSCTNCINEKMSSPLYIHCIGCNRNKGLHDKFQDKDEPTKG